jgi:hypothetical protein
MPANLPTLLRSQHDLLIANLGVSRAAIGHPGAKGESSEAHWISMIETYLPRRYQVRKAFIVDSRNAISDQIDIVIHDRQYSPFVFTHEGADYVPAESVYAAFEVKQEIDAATVAYAGEKVASIRRLHRTSLPVPHISGTAQSKSLPHIFGGLLSLGSAWNPPLSDPLVRAIENLSADQHLDLGFIATSGIFQAVRDPTSERVSVSVTLNQKAAAAFLLTLIARLQTFATVPMIDVMAYAQWLSSESHPPETGPDRRRRLNPPS